MNMQQLRYVVITSETLNYTHTANRCYTSRQAISQSIHDLERELNVRLFDNTGRCLSLTSVGESFVRRARRTVKSYDDLTRDFQNCGRGSGNIGPLRIGFDTSLLSNEFTVSTFLLSDPRHLFGLDVQVVECSTETCARYVISHDVDVGILGCMPRRFPELEVVQLVSGSIGFLVREKSPLAVQEKLSFADLAKLDLIVPIDFEFKYQPLIRAAHEANVRLTPKHYCDRGNVALRLLSNYSVMLADDLDAVGVSKGGVRYVGLMDSDLKWSVLFVYRKDSERKKSIERMGQHLLAHTEATLYEKRAS